MAALWEKRAGRLSYQVLQEFYVTVTAKLSPGMDRDAARRDVQALLAWKPLPVGPHLLTGVWHFQDRYRLSFWNAMIAAAARALGCGYLLSENFQENRILGDLRAVNPFNSRPEILDEFS